MQARTQDGERAPYVKVDRLSRVRPVRVPMAARDGARRAAPRVRRGARAHAVPVRAHIEVCVQAVRKPAVRTARRNVEGLRQEDPRVPHRPPCGPVDLDWPSKVRVPDPAKESVNTDPRHGPIFFKFAFQ